MLLLNAHARCGWSFKTHALSAVHMNVLSKLCFNFCFHAVSYQKTTKEEGYVGDSILFVIATFIFSYRKIFRRKYSTEKCWIYFTSFHWLWDEHHLFYTSTWLISKYWGKWWLFPGIKQYWNSRYKLLTNKLCYLFTVLYNSIRRRLKWKIKFIRP